MSYLAYFLINTSSHIESLFCVYFFSIPMKKRFPVYISYPLTFLLSFAFIAFSAWIRFLADNIATGIAITLLMNASQIGCLFFITKESLSKTIAEFIGAFAVNFIVAQVLGMPDISRTATGFLPFGWTTGNIIGDLMLRLLLRGAICFPIAWFLAWRKTVIDDRHTRIATIVTISLGSLFIAVLSRLTTYLVQDNAAAKILLSVSQIAICILLLYLRTRIFDYSRQQTEILAMQAVIDSQNSQYEHFRDSVSYVNTVCHDLKKQINGIRNRLDDEEYEAIQKALSMYNGRFKTGNEALDMVLYQSRLQCEKNAIHLTVMADGRHLSFLSHYDAYALLNNALSNAIEATMKIDDPEKRIISLVIDRKPPFVTIEVENYFNGDLHRNAQGEIETSKKDGRLHGLGIKSMARILEDYDGFMKIRTDGDIFDLFITIPLQEKTFHDANS